MKIGINEDELELGHVESKDWEMGDMKGTSYFAKFPSGWDIASIKITKELYEKFKDLKNVKVILSHQLGAVKGKLTAVVVDMAVVK